MHGEALEYDLTRSGLDLRLAGTPALSWRRLRVFIREAQNDTTTAIFRHLNPDEALWPLHVPPMLARAVHALEAANWQRGADKHEARAKKNYPKPYLLPGQVLEQAKEAVTKTFKGAAVPIETMRRLLGW